MGPSSVFLFLRQPCEIKKPQKAMYECIYSDTSANEDNSFRNHIR